MSKEWTKFSDAQPKESGDYWIYRDNDPPLPRVFQVYHYKKHGWNIDFKFKGYTTHKEGWTH